MKHSVRHISVVQCSLSARLSVLLLFYHNWRSDALTSQEGSPVGLQAQIQSRLFEVCSLTGHWSRLLYILLTMYWATHMFSSAYMFNTVRLVHWMTVIPWLSLLSKWSLRYSLRESAVKQSTQAFWSVLIIKCTASFRIICLAVGRDS